MSPAEREGGTNHIARAWATCGGHYGTSRISAFDIEDKARFEVAVSDRKNLDLGQGNLPTSEGLRFSGAAHPYLLRHSSRHNAMIFLTIPIIHKALIVRQLCRRTINGKPGTFHLKKGECQSIIATSDGNLTISPLKKGKINEKETSRPKNNPICP